MPVSPTSVSFGSPTILSITPYLSVIHPHFFPEVLQAWQFVIGVQVAIHTWPSWLSLEGWFEVERLDSDLRGMRGVFVVGVIFAFMVRVSPLSDMRLHYACRSLLVPVQLASLSDRITLALPTNAGSEQLCGNCPHPAGEEDHATPELPTPLRVVLPQLPARSRPLPPAPHSRGTPPKLLHQTSARQSELEFHAYVHTTIHTYVPLYTLIYFSSLSQ